MLTSCLTCGNSFQSTCSWYDEIVKADLIGFTNHCPTCQFGGKSFEEADDFGQIFLQAMAGKLLKAFDVVKVESNPICNACPAKIRCMTLPVAYGNIPEFVG